MNDLNADESNPYVPLAIVGMGCLFPRSAGPGAYWGTIRNSVDAISDIPSTHWRPEDYFSADQKKADHTYARRGGFISPVHFNPLEFGITPNNLEATDTSQLLGMWAAGQALKDAGFDPKKHNKDRVSVIVGVTGTLELVIPLGARLGHPLWRKALKDSGVPDAQAEDAVQRIADGYVNWQENSFPGLLGNVVAGRIANRFDLGGTNCVVDAACASSLSAIHLAGLELAERRSDMVVTGGVDTFNSIFMYMCFSKTPALSPSGNARPFDRDGDGTILGEGLGLMVLKRLDDAKRDGDRIYAVIKSIGSSSDGKGNAIYAPRREGQVRALKNAYKLANVAPESIELIEAHGTGTKVGDATELSALTDVFREARPEGTWCALGSVKSQIGHTKAAAGVAGLMKAVLALHFKTLPPTMKIEQPLDGLAPGKSPFYACTQKRPWLPRAEHPRRAGLSAFGFGGSNFHCVLEEAEAAKNSVDWDGDVQLAAFSAPDAAVLLKQLDAFPVAGTWDSIRVAAQASRAAFRSKDVLRLLVVLQQNADAKMAIEQARRKLGDNATAAWTLPDGTAFGAGAAKGQLGVLFPGQGSQYVGMLRDLACQFPEMLGALTEADAAYAEGLSLQAGERLSDRIYPYPAFDDESRERQEERLRATDTAQPALGAVSIGAWRVLERFGVRADATAGHSYGELTALCGAGVITPRALHALSRVRGDVMAAAGRHGDAGTMLAVQAPLATVEALIRDEKLDVVLANRNAPNQAVLSGASAAIEKAQAVLKARGVTCKKLNVAAAFHSALVADAQKPLAAALAGVTFAAPRVPVFSNTTGQAYPSSPEESRRQLAKQLASPVQFVSEIENLHAAGVTTFLEVGPGAKLGGLVRAILGERPHTVIALDSSSGQRAGIADLARTLAQLAALGHTVTLAPWDEAFDPASLSANTEIPGLTVPLNGANYVRPKTARPPTPVARPAAVPSSPSSAPAVKSMSNPIPTSPPSMATPRATPMNSSLSSPLPVSAASAGAVAQAWQATQANLAALQAIQEQTAQLHRQFLEGQAQAVRVYQALLEQQMGALLGRAPVTALPAIPAMPVVAAPVAMPMPAPKPVAVPEPAPAQAVVQAASPSRETETVLLAVVSETTGYPAEMLNLDMELDADLGIDSIKRVEILSILQERIPGAPAVLSDQMGSLRTLRQVCEYLSGGASGPAQGTVPAVAPATDNIEKVLLAVISESTGYPAEMLNVDMELDADLGIDSIKRVEIFSELSQRFPHLPEVKLEELGGLRTLRQVVEHLGGATRTAKPVPAPEARPVPVEAGVSRAAKTGVRAPLERLVLEMEHLNGGRAAVSVAGGEIWITNDGSPLAERLAARLAKRQKTRVIALDAIPELNGVNLSGLVILAPQRGADDVFLQRAFALLQRAGAALRQAGQKGGAVLATLARIDGAFGMAGIGVNDAISGGLSGLAKTAAHEWPGVQVKALDLATDFRDLEAAAAVIAEEIFTAGPVEVGVSAHARYGLKLVAAPFGRESSADLPFAPGDAIVVSGGARGVTAASCLALAKAFKPTLILLGRSAPPQPEPDWLAGMESEKSIKQELLARAGGPANPKKIEEELRNVLSNRELLHNLAAIEAAGARVIYRSVDVRDGAALSALFAKLRATTGPIKGLVHGAGVLADRLIEDKTLEQFERVYSTKVAGLRALLEALRGDPLKAIVVFSSSTGRYGRRGQADYAVANEVLNKLAQQQSRRRPECRVVAVNWGPWDGGMVTPALRKVFEKEEVGLIGLEAGGEHLVREICSQGLQPVEVVVLGAGSREPSPQAVAPANGPAPIPPTMQVAFERDVDIARYPFLASHVIDGSAVLPMAMMAEFLAQGALHTQPGFAFHGVDDLRVLKGVVFNGVPVRLRVLAGKAEKRGEFHVVPTELRSEAHGVESLNARASIVLASRLP
ncbi:MAG: SDR family NAD(P)-dependent oxidoreductase, partial [Planctomycetes bacterium]|nr:SDR family NAD(P)-dependent oxidoreductase [Planctomycetota bacterium]